MRKKLWNKTAITATALLLSASVTACSAKAAEPAAKTGEDGEAKEKAVEPEKEKMPDGVSEIAAEKQETVYVNAAADGTTEKVTVSEWLKNKNGSALLEDMSDLSNVFNVKGEEAFTESKDGSLLWAAGGSDIYYQGETSKELPVSMKLTYYLDGKEISPEELAGKSGHVKIRIDYSNHTLETVVEDGKSSTTCTPFLMATGMLLPEETFRNVEVTNGQLLSDGKENMVLGVAFPGLSESLDLKERESELLGEKEIPDYVEIEADVEDFSLAMTATVATTGMLSEFGLDEVDSVDDLQDSLDQLSDASAELLSGTGELKDGTVKLSDGVRELLSGMETLRDGAGDLKSGIEEYTDGVDTLAGGAGDLDAGAGRLKDGSAALASGADALVQGAEALKQGADQLAAGYEGELGLVLGAEKLAAGAAQVSAGLNSLPEQLAKQIKGAGDAQKQNAAALLAQYGFADVTELEQKIGTVQASLTAHMEQLLNSGITIQESLDQEKAALEAERQALEAEKAAFEKEKQGGGENGSADAQTPAQPSAPSEDAAGAVTEQPKTPSEDAGAAPVQPETPSDTAETVPVQPQKPSEDAKNPAVQPGDTESTGETLPGAEAGTAGTENAGAQTDGEKSGDGSDVETPADTEAQAAPVSYAGNKRTSGAVLALSTDDSQAVTTSVSGDVLVLMQAIASEQQELGNLLSLRARIAGYEGAVTALDGVQQEIGKEAQSGSLKALLDGAAQTAEGAKQLAGGSRQLADGTKALQDGLNQMIGQSGTLISGTKELAQGAADLKAGTGQLKDGSAKLKDNSGKLRDGASKLKDGSGDLLDGGKELSDGVADLDEGAGKLADGMAEFDRDGIQELTGAGDDLQEVLDQLKTLVDADKSYKSFGGCAEGTESSVKFVIETAGIHGDE